MTYGDCDECANYGTYMCEECEHSVELYDHFEQMDEEDKAKRKEEWLKKLPTEIISVDVPAKLLECFGAAKNFTAELSPGISRKTYAAVYFGDDYIAATDSFTLIEFADIDIPQELKGRFVLSINGGEARVMTEPETNSPLIDKKHRKHFDRKGYRAIESATKETLTADVVGPGIVCFRLGLSLKIHFKRELFERAVALFGDGDVFSLHYKGKRAPIHFVKGSMTAIVLPLIV